MRRIGMMEQLGSLILSLFLSLAQPAGAEAVLVRGSETGQGFLFSYHGNCYLITAAHVVASGHRAQVLTADGDEGAAAIQRPFWPGMDLAVGALRRPPTSGCGAPLGRLDAATGRLLQGRQAQLPYVASNSSAALDVAIERVDYLELAGRLQGEAPAALQGVSGGMLMLDGAPVGMARAADPDGRMHFIRVEEIAMNLERWLGQPSAAAEVEPQPAAADAVKSSTRKLELVSAAPPTLDAMHLPEALLAGEGTWLLPPGARPQLVLRQPGDEMPTLSRLRLTPARGDGIAAPRGYRIDVAASDGDDPVWRLFAAGELPPDVELDTGPKARARARLIRINLLSTWGEGSVGIAALAVE